jgi:2-isopropylmalate synthase
MTNEKWQHDMGSSDKRSKRITVFGGSRCGPGSAEYQEALTLGRLLVQAGYVGNTPMDTLLVNLVLMGYIERDLSALGEYCRVVSEATGVPIPANYPVIGKDAFRTATGVHAAAVIKAYRKNDQALVDAVYSGIPASMVGREQEIEVGPMSGKSNVVFWLEKRGLPTDDTTVERIFARAKASTCVLSEDEIRSVLVGEA